MNVNPKPPISSPVADTNCTICLEKIVTENPAPCKEEKPIILDCSHIFHRECIGSWLKEQPTCPICKRNVTVGTPEARLPETSLQEILAVPDHQQPVVVEDEHTKRYLLVIRQTILETRRGRLLTLRQVPVFRINGKLYVPVKRKPEAKKRFFQ